MPRGESLRRSGGMEYVFSGSGESRVLEIHPPGGSG
jgi:hypothetical protein